MRHEFGRRPEGDRKGPHHSRPYYDNERGIILSGHSKGGTLAVALGLSSFIRYTYCAAVNPLA